MAVDASMPKSVAHGIDDLRGLVGEGDSSGGALLPGRLT